EIRMTLLKTYQIPPKAWDEPAREGAVEGAEDKGDDGRRHAAPSKSPQKEQSATTPSRGLAVEDPRALESGTLLERTHALLAYLAVPGRTPQELAAAREIRGMMMFEARCTGAMKRKAALHEHPDWPAYIEYIVTALDPLPAALDAFEAFIRSWTEQHAG